MSRKSRKQKRQKKISPAPAQPLDAATEQGSEEISSWVVRWDLPTEHCYLRLDEDGSRYWWVPVIWEATEFETEIDAQGVAVLVEVQHGEVSVSGLGGIECSPGFQAILDDLEHPPAS